MEPTKTIKVISKRTIALSGIILLSLSSTANNLYSESGIIKNNMYVFYLTAVLFFTLFLLYVKISRSQKNVKISDASRKHYHYRRVVKKTP